MKPSSTSTTVGDFLCESLTAGASTIVVATSPHRDGFISALRERGVDVDFALLTESLIVLDARETLAAFMAADGPDPARFQGVITAIMDRARAGPGPLRVYGEMVAVLWADGDVGSAIALEDLWNGLAAERDFLLLCAYPMSALDDPSDAAAVVGDGTFTVADEHLATATCERALAGLYPSLLSHRPRSRERLLVAAVQSVAPGILLLLGGQGIDSQWARAGFPVADSAEQAPRIVEALLRERPDIPVEPPRRCDHTPVPWTKRDPTSALRALLPNLVPSPAPMRSMRSMRSTTASSHSTIPSPGSLTGARSRPTSSRRRSQASRSRSCSSTSTNSRDQRHLR